MPSPIPGLAPDPNGPRRILVTCPTAGIARIDVDLGNGANTVEASAAGNPRAARPFLLPVAYHGGPGPDQVGAVSVSPGTVIDGQGGDDTLAGRAGRVLGGPGIDTIGVQDTAPGGVAGERTVADGGEGDDRLSGGGPDRRPGGHLLGGPGNDILQGFVVEGGEGNDQLSGSVVDGGPGNDVVFVPGVAGTLRCGNGSRQLVQRGQRW